MKVRNQNERAFVLSPEMEERIIAEAQRYKSEPHQLMRILLRIQRIAYNSFPREVAVIVSQVTGIDVATLYSYTSFYAMIADAPRGKLIVRMCESAPCHISGARDVMEAIEKALGIAPGETTPDGMFTLEYCQCLGMCERSPAIMVNGKVYTDLTPGKATDLMEQYMRGEIE